MYFYVYIYKIHFAIFYINLTQGPIELDTTSFVTLKILILYYSAYLTPFHVLQN